MLVDAIKFEIRNFTDGSFEKFMVDATEENYALIAAHRFTREIEFTQVFDFQFERETHCPKFIMFGAAVADALAENENVMDIDDIDEMHGSY